MKEKQSPTQNIKTPHEIIRHFVFRITITLSTVKIKQLLFMPSVTVFPRAKWLIRETYFDDAATAITSTVGC